MHPKYVIVQLYQDSGKHTYVAGQEIFNKRYFIILVFLKSLLIKLGKTSLKHETCLN